MIFLSKVSQTFQIKGRGCIIVPGLPPVSEQVPKVQIGDRLKIECPSGKIIETHVRGLEMIKPHKNEAYRPFLTGKSVHQDDIEPGSSVWLITEQA